LLSDHELQTCVKRVMTGDISAEEQWFGWAWPAGLKWAMLRCRDGHRAQDAVVDALRDLRAGKLREAAAMTAWFRAIVVRKCLRQGISKAESLDEGFVGGVEEAWEGFERKEMRSWVRRSIAELDAPQREVVVLYYLAGYPTRETAQLLGLPLTTVKKRLVDARETIRIGGLSMMSNYGWNDEQVGGEDGVLKECWGIDAGPQHLNAIRLLKVNDVLVIGGFESRYDAPGAGTQIDPQKGLQEQLRGFAARHGVEGKRLFFSVPGTQVFARVGRRESGEDQEAWAKRCAPEAIFPMRWCTGGREVFGTDGEMMVAVSQKGYEELVGRYRCEGAQCVGLVPDFTAQCNALLHEYPLQQGARDCALVHVGSTDTRITFMGGGTLWCRVAPLVSVSGISDELARRLMRQDAAALEGIGEALKPIAARMEHLVGESVQFFEESLGLRRWRPEVTIGCGPAVHHAAVVGALHARLGAQVSAGITFRETRVAPDKVEELRFLAPNLVTAFGAALQGVGLGRLDVNLVAGRVAARKIKGCV
jgi:RNA polymerase sigma factor (sigma-70 family)